MSDVTTVCPPLPTQAYGGTKGSVQWTGLAIDGDTVAYLKSGVLKDRLTDAELTNALQRDLQLIASKAKESQRSVENLEVAALLTVDISGDEGDEGEVAGSSSNTSESGTDHQAALLHEGHRKFKSWEIGEAMAEVLLAGWHSARWVWNNDRDLMDPNASLPGADLAGFHLAEDGVPRFLFGEVKTSSDKKCPPGVMSGREGLIRQLEDLFEKDDYSVVLVRWLRARIAEGTKSHDMFLSALNSYWQHGTKSVVLIGCLIRDTIPNETDVINRADALSKTVSAEKVSLHVWYVPDSISSLGDYLGGSGD